MQSGKELGSHAGAELCKRPRRVSLEMLLLCWLVACRFSLSFPPCLSSAALRGHLGNEESRAAGVGWGGTEVTGARCIQTTSPRGIRHHQHVPRVIVIPQAMSRLKCT